MIGAVHLLYIMAQLEDSIGYVARKRRERLQRQVQGESQGGLRWLTSSKASKTIVAKAKMAFRGAGGKA